MNADIVVKVHGRDSADLGNKIEAIDAIARTPQEVPPGGGPPDRPVPPAPPVVQQPYFDIGDATGKPGDVVTLSVEAGCRYPTNGFHIGGGVGLLPDVERSGYGKFEAVGVTLGSFLHDYLKSQGLIVDVEDADGIREEAQYWSLFQFIQYSPQGTGNPLPEEWWEFALGFFSTEQERLADPIQIPSGTELFRLKVKILADTAPGVYDVTCGDERYYTTDRARRRDFLFTTNRESEFARGGITKVETIGGKIAVIQ